MFQACEECKTINRKLHEKPNSIEELAELRDWMKQIPDQLKAHEVKFFGFFFWQNKSLCCYITPFPPALVAKVT